MALNTIFNQGGGLSSGLSNEQTLINNLYTEAIKIYGFDVFYIPRTLVNLDKVFQEDELSKFTSAHAIEMYLQSVDGYEGEGDFLSFETAFRFRSSSSSSSRPSSKSMSLTTSPPSEYSRSSSSRT